MIITQGIYPNEVEMNPFLQGLLDQLKNLEVDLPALLVDEDFLPAVMQLLPIILRHAHVKAPTE